MSKKPTSKQPDFEEAIDEVEAIISRIERGDVGLEESLAQYEKGVSLVKVCRATLERVEQRIQELSALADADGAEGGSDASMDVGQAD